MAICKTIFMAKKYCKPFETSSDWFSQNNSTKPIEKPKGWFTLLRLPSVSVALTQKIEFPFINRNVYVVFVVSSSDIHPLHKPHAGVLLPVHWHVMTGFQNKSFYCTFKIKSNKMWFNLRGYAQRSIFTMDSNSLILAVKKHGIINGTKKVFYKNSAVKQTAWGLT